MNKRQKKKLYRKRVGHNPEKWIKFSEEIYRLGIHERISVTDLLKELENFTCIYDPYRTPYKENTENTVNTARILSRRRKK